MRFDLFRRQLVFYDFHLYCYVIKLVTMTVVLDDDDDDDDDDDNFNTSGFREQRLLGGIVLNSDGVICVVIFRGFFGEFFANVNSRSRSLYAIARPSVCRL